MSEAFHEVRFPSRVARGSTGGPGGAPRSSVSNGSGAATPAGAPPGGVTTPAPAVAASPTSTTWSPSSRPVRGRLYGFRWRDPSTAVVCAGCCAGPDGSALGGGDGATRVFRLVKSYASGRRLSARHRQAGRGDRAGRRRRQALAPPGLRRRSADGARHLSGRRDTGLRRRRHGGLRVRCAGAFRCRSSRSRPDGVQRRADPRYQARGDRT